MTCLVSYDVTDDRRRDRLSRVLLDYGSRVQDSVFWVDADDDLMDRMRTRITAAIGEEDSIWIVPVCLACGKKIETMGTAHVPTLPEYYII